MARQSSTSLAAALLEVAATSRSLRPCALLEVAAFAAGEKPALRFVLDPGDETGFLRTACAFGLDLATRCVFLESRGGSWFSLVPYRTERERLLVVIAAADHAERLVEAETLDSERAGVMLGYPACCVKAFQRLAEAGGRWGQALSATAVDARAIDARCNRFAAEWGGIGVMGELFPCSLECEHAKAYGESLYRSTVRLGLHRLAVRAKTDSLRPVVVSDDGTVSVVVPGTTGSLGFVWNASNH